MTNEKNELREEKAALKADIENLNAQYQQRLRTMFPWGAVDHSVVMAPPSYPFPMPMPMPMPPGSIPMHPHMQPYPYFGNQNPGVIPNPCSTFVPYITPNTLVEQQHTPYASPVVHPATQSHVSVKQDSRNKSSGASRNDRSEESNNVTTDLELKTPGSTDQVHYSCFTKYLQLNDHFKLLMVDLVGFIMIPLLGNESVINFIVYRIYHQYKENLRSQQGKNLRVQKGVLQVNVPLLIVHRVAHLTA